MNGNRRGAGRLGVLCVGLGGLWLGVGGCGPSDESTLGVPGGGGEAASGGSSGSGGSAGGGSGGSGNAGSGNAGGSGGSGNAGSGGNGNAGDGGSGGTVNEGGGPGTGGTSSAGDAGVDASSDAGSDAGTPVEEADAGADSGTFCEPGSTLVCYEGDPETAGEGSCQTGLSECDSEGAAYGPCVGQVLPIAEDCSTPEDDDCDTLVNEDCPVPTTYDDVQPVLQARCSPCHSTGGSGGHNSATSYADTQLSSYYCSGATKGACLLVRVQNGSMPLGAGCTGDPDQDASNSSCLSAAEQQLLADWIADGQLP